MCVHVCVFVCMHVYACAHMRICVGVSCATYVCRLMRE